MKRFLLLVLTVMSAVATWAYDAVVDGIYYNLNESDMTASVTWGSVAYGGDVVIPEKVIIDEAAYTVTSIGASAFYYSGVSCITLPATLTSIGQTAFYSCSALTEIDLPDGLTSIGRHAFARCTSLTDIVLPNTVRNLGEYAFSGCAGLLTVGLSSSLMHIDEAVFYQCESLTSVNIPASVETIGRYAFGGCPAISSLTVEQGSEWFFSDGNCIMDRDNRVVLGCRTSVIPDYATAIGYGAFYFSYNLPAITIPDAVTVIETSAFEGCAGLQEVVIGSGVTTIGDRAFEECTALTEVVIPDGVTSIGNSVFWYCQALKKVTLGTNVAFVDYYTFTGCKALRTMTCLSQVMTECDEDAFYELDVSKGTLYVPAALVSQYRDTAPWSSWGSIEAIVDPSSVVLPTAEPSESAIYTLDGMRVTTLRKGLYIINGKKEFVGVPK